MTATSHEDQQSGKTHAGSGAESRPEAAARKHAEELRRAGGFRDAGIVVLAIAAVFVINAMETGSYRTPWPVALGSLLAGLGLLGYSWYLRSRSNS